jgi:hypothetical protein
MADKSVGELIAAQSVTPTDLFVLEQNGTAKKLTGQILENWLVSFADGHGGIQSIAKLSTSGLADTYRITLADTTTFDFVVTNGRGVSSLRKTGTSGLVDTYTFTYNDGTTGTFTVTNGEKGDKGDNTYVWIKYASQQPTATSHSFGDVPDAWIGIYFGSLASAPTDWQQYKWYNIKGNVGDTGAAATLVSSSITYQVGDSGTVIPSGSWTGSVPSVTPGKYLWTRQMLQFNTGSPITSYSVSRFGIDGAGSVSTVAGVAPDANGNVPLTAASVKALSENGGNLYGGINMNGQTISGLNPPTESTQPATKGWVESRTQELSKGGTGATTAAQARENLEVTPDNIGAISKKLLWTNPDPTAEFIGQGVSIPAVPSGRAVLILFSGGDVKIAAPGLGGMALSFDGEVSYRNAYRQFNVNASGTVVTFLDAKYRETYGGTGVVQNALLIPRKIYEVNI